MSSSGQGTRPLVARAAQSIAESMGLADTMVDVLRARAFEPYAEGLRQYLIIRLGSVEEGTQAFLELRTSFAGQGTTDMLSPPGIRANLYAMARQIVEHHWENDEGAAGASARALPFRKPGFGVSEHYLLALSKLRKELPESEAELLELRHARELDSREIAHVLSIDEDKIELRLEMALAQARRVLGGKWADPGEGLDTLVLEAFALERPEDDRRGREDEGEALEPGTVVGGRYELETQAGSGGMGNVYRANDTEVPGHVVALKLLHHPARSQAARQAALRELHLIASVFHPSVVQFKDHGWYDDRLWFVMPWYEGESLQDRIEREPLTRAEARTIFEPLALALSTMHSAGIRHQDIKPDNIFLARLEGVGDDGGAQALPVLLDLGVAAKEAELVLAGTPIYFAPEVAAQYARVTDPHPVTAKADVFSLCLSLRNALEPSTREDVAAGAVERFIEIRAEQSPSPPLGEELGYLEKSFERWLAVDPDERPDAIDLARELAVLTEPEERRERRLRLLRWLGPLLLALIAVFGAVVYGFSRQAEFQKLEAARARLEAEHARLEAQRARLVVAEVQEDLTEAAERERELEADVARTLKRYQSSEMTREQLTSKLATAEGQLRMTRELYADEKRRSRYIGSQLEDAQERGEELEANLSKTRSRLASQRERAEALTSGLAEVREQLAASRQEAEASAERVSALSVQVIDLERQLDTQQSQVAQRQAELDQARTELAGARRRIAMLERQLARLRRGARPPPNPGRIDPPDSRPSPSPAPSPAPTPSPPAPRPSAPTITPAPGVEPTSPSPSAP